MKLIKGTSKCAFAICERNGKLHNTSCRNCNKTALNDSKLVITSGCPSWSLMNLLKHRCHQRFLRVALSLGHRQSCPRPGSRLTSLLYGTRSEELFPCYASPSTNLILPLPFCVLKALSSPCPFYSHISYVNQHILD